MLLCLLQQSIARDLVGDCSRPVGNEALRPVPRARSHPPVKHHALPGMSFFFDLESRPEQFCLSRPPFVLQPKSIVFISTPRLSLIIEAILPHSLILNIEIPRSGNLRLAL